MKAGSNFQQTCHSRPHHYSSLGRISDARDYFQQRALAGAVPADNADDVPFVDVERDVFQSPKMFFGICVREILSAKAPKCSPLSRQSRSHSALLEGIGGEQVFLRQMLDLQYRLH